MRTVSKLAACREETEELEDLLLCLEAVPLESFLRNPIDTVKRNLAAVTEEHVEADTFGH
jgi:hypothetical protein